MCKAQNIAPIITSVSPNLTDELLKSLKKKPPITQANTEGHIDQCIFSEDRK